MPVIDNNNPDLFLKLLNWCEKFTHFAFYINSRSDFRLAYGVKRQISLDTTDTAFAKLEKFQAESNETIAGYLGYDLKNNLEKLISANGDILEFPEAILFEPEGWIDVKNGKIQTPNAALQSQLKRTSPLLNNDINKVQSSSLSLEANTSRDEYIIAINEIKTHLQRGDIYEANYCMQFEVKSTYFHPAAHFLKLQELTEAPMSVFAKMDRHFILSASPERFLKNTNGHLVSQPIKGTIKRSQDILIDKALKDQLSTDSKEKSENVMIVDLVRNDLSRVAQRGSVKVDQLFEPVTFKTVHHLVSTISAEINKTKHNSWDAIKACFPMGSMTGAPKISAMKIIDEKENFKRAAYSGAFGWMDSKGDFDFNVLIRSIFYNDKSQKLAFSVGSAITIQSDPEKEYDECMVKAEALLRSLELDVAKNEIVNPVQ